MAEFAYNNSHHANIGMPPFEALRGEPCRTPLWWKPKGIVPRTRPELVMESVEKMKKIRNRLKAAQDRQRKYANVHRRPLEFQEGEHVWIMVSPMRGVSRFGVSGKLSPRYIGLFEIIRRIRMVAYELALPPQLDRVHPVFHVSQLRRYFRDPLHHLDHSNLKLKTDLTYEEKPSRILDTNEQQLRTQTIRYVLVQWSRHSDKEATWELKEAMRERYLELFHNSGVTLCSED
jgi:hypothetical protein